LFLLNVIDGRDGGRQRLQLVLRGIPLALVDQLLYLGQLLRGERHLIGARLLLLAEQHRVQAVQRVARPAPATTAPKPPGTTLPRQSNPPGHRRPGAFAPIRRHASVPPPSRGDGCHPAAGFVAPPGEQLRELGLAGSVEYTGCRDASVEEAVRAVDLVERRVTPVGSPASEVRQYRRVRRGDFGLSRASARCCATRTAPAVLPIASAVSSALMPTTTRKSRSRCFRSTARSLFIRADDSASGPFARGSAPSRTVARHPSAQRGLRLPRDALGNLVAAMPHKGQNGRPRSL
jgi:hypothetical protein